MRIGIVVDSTCDLPVDYLKANDVEILPITVRIGDELQVDYRDEADTLAFLHSHIAERGVSAETIPFSVEQTATCSCSGWWSTTTTCSASPSPARAARSSRTRARPATPS